MTDKAQFSKEFARSQELVREGRLEEAKDHLVQMTGRWPSQWGVWMYLALICSRVGEVQEAQDHALRARDLKPDSEQISILLLGMLLRRDEQEAVMNEIERFLSAHDSEAHREFARDFLDYL